MQLNCPKDTSSINVAGVEYTGKDGVITITDPAHIAAAQANGFTPVEATPVELTKGK